MTRQNLKAANRSFGLVLAAGFGLLAGLRYLLAGAIPWSLLGLGVVLLVAGSVVPTWLEPIRKGWMRLAGVLGAVNSRILLTLLFACLITPIALVLRFLGKRPITLGWEPSAGSYWRPRRSGEFAPERMERQF